MQGDFVDCSIAKLFRINWTHTEMIVLVVGQNIPGIQPIAHS
jgi:hypothetical protein